MCLTRQVHLAMRGRNIRQTAATLNTATLNTVPFNNGKNQE
ncbi:hypothetical protein GCM10010168_93730 [Actinoplanes ianthinogenes]|nr:hypothetical protein GCM10010168_93730 [Actinoplanes ianthinogenes]